MKKLIIPALFISINSYAQNTEGQLLVKLNSKTSIDSIILDKENNKAIYVSKSGKETEKSYEEGLALVNNTISKTTIVADEARLVSKEDEGLSLNKDEDDDLAGRKNALGFFASDMAGYGISYERMLSEKWGIQVTGAGNITQTSGFIVLGIQGIYVIKETNDYRVYSAAGTSLTYNSSRYQNYTDPNDLSKGETVSTNSKGINVGVNPIGFSYFFTKSKAFSVSAQIGFAARFQSNVESKGITFQSFGVSGGAGVLWHFGK